MTQNTPVYGFPFPENTDPPDGPQQFEDLALGVETELVRIDGDVSTLQAADAAAFPVGTGAWTAFTPSFMNLDVGTTGSEVVARYFRVARLVTAMYNITLGTGGGSAGGISITPPVNGVTPPHLVGSAVVLRGGTRKQGSVHMSVDGDDFVLVDTLTGNSWGNSVPLAWASGDILRIQISYEGES